MLSGQNGFAIHNTLPSIPTVRMTSGYQYSIKVNEALESYGARTHGSLARRVERLKRFTDMKNRQYAEDIRVDHARMVANQEREERIQRRVRQIESDAPVFLRRNLRRSRPQVVERRPSHCYNLRPRGLDLLWAAIQNGFVNPNRG